MSKYIKSHSNYRLSSKHQNVKDGKILERDITTIGGVSPFSSNQTAIHSSGNFVIVINDSVIPTRHIEKKGWLSNNISGVTWNAEVLVNQTSDVNGSLDSNIVLKNDFMDFRSFACYGSLHDLIETSIFDILNRFPYEAYTSNGGYSYEKHNLTLTASPTIFDYSGNTLSSPTYEATKYFYEFKSSGTPASYTDISDLYEISNPAGIDMHTVSLDTTVVENELRYFANDGYKNYSVIFDKISTNPSDGFDFEWNSDNNTYIVTKSNITNKTVINAPTHQNFSLQFNEDVTFNKVKPNGSTGSFKCTSNGEEITINAKVGDTLYFRRVTTEDGKKTTYEVSSVYCPQVGDFVSKITLTIPKYNNTIITLYAYRDKNLDVVYLVSKENLFIHIRPKVSLSYYDDFMESLNLFQKALMGYYSGIKYTSKFEVLEETDNGTEKYSQTFVMPTTDGGYNIGGNGMDIGSYISTMLSIGERYDELYTDNMYRSMTHESLKNLDWTRGFNGTDKNDDDTEYLLTGEKFKSVIRIMGYFFDQEKAYIDCLGNFNTITYDNRSNLSDYFISDSLDNDGWNVNNINTYTLTQINSESEIVDEEEWSEINQKSSYYTRLFTENTNDLIYPYDNKEYPQFYHCVSGNVILDTLDYYSDKEYYVDTNKNVHKLIKSYYSDKEYTMPDITNEFMKRLRINSRELWRKKGTIEGIESILSLLGFRGRKWFESLDSNQQKKYIDENDSFLPYDYELYEYSIFANPIHEKWDPTHDMYRIDYLNSCKTISYDTDSSANGIYISYQGLPIAYRDLDDTYLAMSADTSGNTVTYETKDSTDKNIFINSDNELVKARYLYPYFDRLGVYDGGLYYQMKGGWLNYSPYSFDNNDRLVPNEYYDTSKETLRDVKQTNNIKTLLSTPQVYLNDGTIMYVNDLSTNYAIIDSSIYELYTEDVNNVTYYYFTLIVNDGSVWIGNDLYDAFLDAYNPNNDDELSHYYLPALEDGSSIKIYYDKNSENKYQIHGYTSLVYYNQKWVNGLLYTVECESTDDGAYAVYSNEISPISTIAFINGSYHEDYTNYTHYFLLTNINNYDNISDDCWKQLSYSDSEYLKTAGIEDNLNGNNPHCGYSQYDNGYDYILSFKRLFGYAIDNNYFDENSFDYPELIYDELETYGFSGLCEDTMISYLNELNIDTKSHSFASVITDGLINNDSATTYTITHHSLNETHNVAGRVDYDLNNADTIKSISSYAKKINNNSDGVTSQILNTKILELRFSLKADNFYKASAEEQIKYIQCKIMPYVEQMIPSTMIPLVTFGIYPYPYITDASKTNKLGYWGNENYQKAFGTFTF